MTKSEQRILNSSAIFKDSDCSISKQPVSFNAGDVISSPDGERRMGVVLSGRARALSNDKQTLLNIFFKGDVFKVAGLFGTEETCTYIIAETSSKVVFFTRAEMSEIFSKYPKVAENYIRFLSDRISFLNLKISLFSLPSVEARLKRYLLCTLKDADEISISAAKLSLMLSVSRASLYRAFQSLEKQGAISHKTGKIRVLNTALLNE